MKNLFLILNTDEPSVSFDLLKKSAIKRGIKVSIIHTGKFDFSKQIELTNRDSIYRISIDPISILIEKKLINEKVISFYSNYTDCIRKVDNVIGYTLFHEKNGLPIIKTVYSITNNRNLLKKYSETLNGFPLIIKSIGGSHGVGVIKIDSIESLYSIADYLSDQGSNFIMREFIDYVTHARLIVLGDKVISSVEYKRINDDFRSNVGDNLNIENKKFSKEVEKMAVGSVNSLGYEFGGVDVLIDKNNNPFIAEVNFPCYFPRAQEYSGVDISGQMIDYLINKYNQSIK